MENQKENQSQNTALTVSQKGQKMKDLLYSMKEEFRNALPKLIPPEKFIRTVLTSFNRTPKLMDCTPASVFGCLFVSAQLGLIPDGVTGEAYLIPFENRKKGTTECQFIIGYRGIINLAMRSGQVKRFQSRVVYEGDTFDYEFGLNEKLVHKPSGKNDGNITHFYCVIEFQNGGKMFDVMTVQEVNYIRDTSQNYQASKRFGFANPWDAHYKEMGMKTLIRRMGKLAPISPEVQTAISLDELSDIGYSQKLDLHLLEKNVSTEMKDEIFADMQAEQEQEIQEKIEQKLDEKATKVENTEASIFDKLNDKKNGGKK